MTFADIARRVGKATIDHSPTILTSIGVAGVVSTAVLAAKASFRAARMIDDNEGPNGDSIAVDEKELIRERIVLVWKLYIPAMTTGAASIACIIGANAVGARRAAGLAAAYTLAEKGFDDYKAKVVERLGEKKEEAVRAEVAQDRLNDLDLSEAELAAFGDHDMCFDTFSCLPFTGSVEGIRAAVNSFNKMVLDDGYGCLADFYRMLDTIEVPAYTENIGWNSDRLMDVGFSTTLLHGTKPVITISYRHDPMPDYGRFRGR